MPTITISFKMAKNNSLGKANVEAAASVLGTRMGSAMSDFFSPV